MTTRYATTPSIPEGLALSEHTKSYDALIVGAGPSGAAASLAVVKAGQRALLIDAATFPRPRACAGLFTPRAADWCRRMGISLDGVAAPVAGLRLHSWDFTRAADAEDDALQSWVADRAKVDMAIVQTAQQAGADAVFGVRPTAVSLGEQLVELQLSNGETIRGAALIIADGVNSATAELAGLSTLPMQDQFSAIIRAPMKSQRATVEAVIGGSRFTQSATLVRSREEMRISFVTRRSASEGAAELNAWLAAGVSSGALPPEVAAPKHRTSTACPAGVALELETHVGKRCLRVGDAGGFVTAFSAEGIYPAMRSGELAGEVVVQAIRAAVFQDRLAEFDTLWRAELAEYLRMPNADLSLLIPLVFKNAQMTRRVARAFLLGERF